MKLLKNIGLLFFVVFPLCLFAQRDNQRVFELDNIDVVSDFEKARELFSNEMYAASLMVLNDVLPDLKSDSDKELAKFLIASSRAILQQQHSIDILNEYIAESNSEKFKNDARVVLAENYLLLENFDKTKEVYNQINIKQLDKKYETSYYYIKAYLTLMDGDIEQAESLFIIVSYAGGRHKHDAEYFLGYIDYLKGDYEEALVRFDSAIQAGGVYSKAAVYKGQIKFAQKDFDYVIDNKGELLMHKDNKKLYAEIYRMIALSYYNKRMYVDAITYFDQFKRNNGTMKREEYYSLGYSYYMLNNYNKAIEQFVNILDDSDRLTQNAYYLLGDAYIKSENKAGALKAFSMASSMDYDKLIEEDAMYNYCKLTYEMDEGAIYVRKINVLERFCKKYPNSKHYNEVSKYLLDLYINNADYNAAIALSERVKEPSSEVRQALQRAFYDQGIVEYGAKSYDKAVEMFKKSLSYNASSKFNALSQFWIAESMYARGDYNNDVIWLYKKYLKMSSPMQREYKLANYSIAYTYFNTEQWGFAITWFEKFIQIGNSDDEMLRDSYARMGDSWFSRRDYRRATECYSKARGVGEDDYTDYQLALTYGMSGDNQSKVRELKRIISVAKSSYYYEAIMELASTYLKINAFEDAKKVLIFFIDKTPQSVYIPKALLELGVANVNLNKSDEAVKIYKKIIRDYPVSPEAEGALISLKSIYVSRGDVKPYFDFIATVGHYSKIDDSEKEQITYDAVLHQYTAKEFKRAVKSGEEYLKDFTEGKHKIDVVYYIADASDRLSDNVKALYYYNIITDTSLNQYSVSAYDASSKIHYTNKDYDKAYIALVSISKYSTSPNERREAIERSMHISLITKDSITIKEAYETVLSSKNITGEVKSLAQYAYGKDLYENKEYKKAIDNLNKVSLANSDVRGVEALYLLASSYLAINKYADVENSVIKLSKTNTSYQYWVAKGFVLLGDSYLKQGDKFQAKATYKSIVDGYELSSDGIQAEAKRKFDSISDIDNN